MTIAIEPVEEAAADYLRLVRMFPLRPLRTKEMYDRAVKLASRLAGRVQPLTPGESDYLNVLSRLVEDWDKSHSFKHKKPSPLDLLRFLMEQAEMNVNGLGAVIGSQSAASLILRGKRSISKSQMKKLGNRFKVDPGLFLER
jgi:HTH-type transcriptional regulator / antitoxin HigA